MDNEISIIVVISLIIFSSPLISKFARIPIIPIEIILGSIAATLGFISINHTFDIVAELGFLYLMFLAGLEVDLKKLFKVSPLLIKKGLLYTTFLYIFSIGFTMIFNLSNIFIVTLPLISIGLLASLKKQYGDQEWINIAFTVGLIGEITSIVVLASVSAGLEYGLSGELYRSLILLGLVLLVTVIFY